MVRIGFGQREVGFEKGLAGKFGFVYSLRTSPTPPPPEKEKNKNKKKGDALAVLLFCSYTLLVFRCDRATTPAWTIYNKTV